MRRYAHWWPMDGRWRCVPRALEQRVADQYPIAPEVLALLQPDPCASAFRTSDCEMPNCLAIADGLTPALKAARTAFSLPVVNKPALSSAAALRRCGFASATGFSFAGLGGSRPRRSASTVTAVSSASISTSSNRFSAPAKSVGKKWRCCEARLPGPALPVGTVEGPAAFTVGRAENRSGIVSQAAGLACPNYAADGSPRQQLAGLRIRLVDVCPCQGRSWQPSSLVITKGRAKAINRSKT